MSGVEPKLKIGVWDLELTDQEVSANTLLLKDKDGGDPGESTFEPDLRKEVLPEDFQPGKPFRSIVKIRIKYENQNEDDDRWAMGTGWLVRPDVMVTAGHCAYDWRDALGRAVHINAYIGYHGKASIMTDPNVQTRRAKRIVTTSGWLTSKKNRINDVTFVLLNKPFTQVKPLTFDSTPMQGDEMLGVVGYPGDKIDNIGGTEEKGAKMYQQFAKVKYNLETSEQHMLQYRISTYAGQSGSPVLRLGKDNTYTSIGAHVYGGGMHNSASVVNEPYGNPYNVYIAALRTTAPLTKKGVIYISAASVGDRAVPPPKKMPSNIEEEGFWDVLNVIKEVGAPIAKGVLSVGLPFLGPAGLPIAALANIALGVAGKICESSMEGEESSLPPHLSQQDFTDRALLGEAALTAVLKMKENDRVPEGLFEMMEKTYTSLAPVIKRAASTVLNPLMETALRITLENVAKGKHVPNISTTRQEIKQAEGDDEVLEDPATHSFMRALLSPTLVVEGEEGFFDDLGDHIRRGLKAGRPFFRIAVKGLALLDTVLPESSMEEGATAEAFDIISKRAIMGEAALQAVMNIEHDELNAEGFFDSLKTALQTIGSTVITYAPKVIGAVAPIVQSLMQGQESSLAPRSAPEPPRMELFGPPLLAKKSFANLRTPSGKEDRLSNGAFGIPKMQGQLPIYRVKANAPPESTSAHPRAVSYTLDRVEAIPKTLGRKDSNQDLPLFEKV